MTPKERERMNSLCKQIQHEKDDEKFAQLVTELNNLLYRKDSSLGPQLDTPMSN